ncbi:glycosyl hydrolase family 15 [Halarcobacter ebronensis]|uniref:Glycosyl hydrolase family 15 n=1 Tax=Halarcobacter ebronensis TaxID=1462615 RepID=A0A4Q0YD66_9BACT|nr:glycoside hydrolase family 15 protein [Halarcobacter ebronensis]RXJ67935.1 glycosyl hydrolase family 15 [Halarcobacter ebronensis]
MNSEVYDKLQKHFIDVERDVLSKQNPITGLLPASTAVNAHGDYTDAWVRDNVYSILCVWGLSLAYKKYNPSDCKTYLLSQSVVKLMRGLLLAMMRQRDKVEKFKYTSNPLDALHAKYGTNTGLPVVGDDKWGHLQLDATSLYILMLTQMIASGLNIVYTIDEVNFVQNLVHYISKTYCIPDFGIWERGHKINTGSTEINCSSVGMAKAALEAINGFNLLGNYTGSEGIIHVISSDIARSKFTLRELLPRESSSKESDGALLSIIGYPAYAVEDVDLIKKTKNKILKKLMGKYGCKRFLLDGHQSSLEDSSRLHYEKSELREFKNIESEWPLFFTYLLLDSLVQGDKEEAKVWLEKLEPLFIEKDGKKLLPELYYVPKEFIEEEKKNPGSQKRVPNENIPLVWAQSLYLLSSMILDGILDVNDIDPVNRRKRVGHKRKTYPMVAILSEDEFVKQQLLNYGFNTQTIEELKPLKIAHASELSSVHKLLGKNEKLGLTGKPSWVPRSITTSRLHILAGEYVVFLPYFFNPKGFYFSKDNILLVEHFRASLKFLSSYWDQAGQPILPFLVKEEMLEVDQKDEILKLLSELQSGYSGNIEVKVGFLEQLLTTAGLERIDNLHGYKVEDFNFDITNRTFYTSSLLECEISKTIRLEDMQKYEQEEDNNLVDSLIKTISLKEKTYILEILYRRHNLEYEVLIEDKMISLGSLAQHYYEYATVCQNWAVIRKLSDILNSYDERLEDAVLEIVIRQKRLGIGRAYSEGATLSKPADNYTILEMIKNFSGKNSAERALTQELILHLGHLIRVESQLFEGILTIRSWYFVQLLVSNICKDEQIPISSGYERLISMPPSSIYSDLKKILFSFSSKVEQIKEQENLLVTGITNLDTIFTKQKIDDNLDIKDWAQYRKDSGMISKLSQSFYIGIWYLLQKCKGLVIGDKYDSNNRIGSESTLDTTAGERNFELRVDSLLQSIEAPDYRQLNLELLQTLITIFEENPDIRVNTDLLLDVLIGYAVKIAWQKLNGEENYDEQKGQAWEYFYKLTPKEANEYFIESFMYLLTLEEK